MAKRGGFPGGGMPGNMANLMKQARLGIKAFHVATLTLLKRGAHPHFQEVVVADDVGSHGPHGVVGTDKCGDGHDAGVDKQLAHFGNTTYVLHTVGGGEAEVAVDAAADVVAVKDATEDASLLQLSLESYGDGALSGATEPGEPHHESPLRKELLLVVASEHLVENRIDICCFVCHNRRSILQV